MKFLATVICVVALTLAFAGRAAALTSWYWGSYSNMAWLGPGTSDSDCIWYWTQAACSGGNTWLSNEMIRASGGGTVLVGFENSTRIRGAWSNAGEVGIFVTPGQLGMCCYNWAHSTYWSGDATLGHANAGT